MAFLVPLVLSVRHRSLVLRVSATVLPPEPDGHGYGEQASTTAEPNQSAVAVGVLRSIFGKVHVCGQAAAEVTNADLHGNADRALGGAADAVAIPSNDRRHV